MFRKIKATYDKGVLRVKTPLDLPDGTEVEITVRISSETEGHTLDRGKVREALMASGLMAKGASPDTTTHKRLPLAERKRLARLFAGKPSLSEILISERDGK